MPPSLNAAAIRAGLLFGASSDVEIATAPEAYGALFTRHCGLFAPLLGWRRIAPQPTDVEPVRIDPNIGFARQNGMQLTGAHLIWHLNTPDWFSEIATDAAAQASVDRHITRLVSYYAGQVFSWNVINEEIDSRSGWSRRSAAIDLSAAAGSRLHGGSLPPCACCRPKRPSGLQRLGYRDGHTLSGGSP